MVRPTRWLAGGVLALVILWAPFAMGQGSALVSLIQLIANPNAFDGQRVILYGYAILEFEHNAIYLTEPDAKRATTPNGLWLDLPMGSSIYQNRATFHGRYVLIEGAFNARRRGHGSLFSGTIENITRFEVQRN